MQSAVVVLAGEQAAQLEAIERRVQGSDRRLDLGFLRGVVLVAGQFVERLDVAELLGEPVERVEVVLDVGVLGVELLRALLVVPERRVGDLGFEHGEPLTVVDDREIGLGLVEAATGRRGDRR